MGFICHVLSVGLGNAAIARCSNGKTIMFDAGSSEDFSPAAAIKALWKVDKITELVISHPHKDHISDLPNIYELMKPEVLLRNKSYPNEWIYPEGEKDSDPFRTYLKLHDAYTSDVKGDNSPEPEGNWGGVLLKGYSCSPKQVQASGHDDLNDLSLLAVVRYGPLELVFPGDLGPIGQAALLELYPKLREGLGTGSYRVLIAPHHGHESGVRIDGEIDSALLDAMSPHYVIISDKWKEQSTDRDAYESRGAQVITTKVNNEIQIYVDDNGLFSINTI